MNERELGRLIQQVEDLRAAVNSAVGGLVRTDVCALRHEAIDTSRLELIRRVTELEVQRDDELRAKATAGAAARSARMAMWATIVVGLLALVGTVSAALIARGGK